MESFISPHVQVMKLVSLTAIQSKIKISIGIRARLYSGLIANSDQSFHYYKILSEAVRQRELSQFQKLFFS